MGDSTEEHEITEMVSVEAPQFTEKVEQIRKRKKVPSSPPQDTGYSWVVLGASFMLAFHYSCLLSHFGIFLVEYIEYFDVRKSSLVWIGSLLTSVGFIFGNVSTLLIWKFGFRKFGFATGAGACVSFLVTALAPNVAFLYLGSGIGASFSFINMFLMSMVAVQCYFDKKRAFASGVHTAGLSVGVFVWPLVSRFLIDYYGWRGAMTILAALQLHTLIYSALIRPVPVDHTKQIDKKEKQEITLSQNSINDKVREVELTEEEKQLNSEQDKQTTDFNDENNDQNEKNKNKKDEQNSSGFTKTCTSIMKSTIYPIRKFPEFRIGLIGFVLMQCGYINFYMMVPSLAKDYGISKDLGGTVVSIFGAVNGVFRVVVGFIGDKPWVDKTALLGLGAIFGGVISLFSLLYTTFLHLAFFAAFYAISSAIYMVLCTPVVRGMVGLQHLPVAVGTVAFFIGFDHLVTVFFAGILYDLTDNAGYNFVLYGSIQIISGLIFIILVKCQGKFKKSDKENENTETREEKEVEV